MTDEHSAPQNDGVSPDQELSWPLPRRRELFADPQAKVLWPAIIALPEATQHDVLRELQLRLAVPEQRDTPQQVRRARAISALREAHDILYAEVCAGLEPGQSLPPVTELQMTVEQFDRILAQNSDRGWPPRSTIIRWLGNSWAAALRAAKLPASPGGQVVRARQGQDFTAEETYAAIRECAADLGRTPTLAAYRRWANSDEVLAREGRRPRSQAAAVRLAGSWNEALAQAKLVEMTEAGPVSTTPGTYRVTGYRFTPEQIRAAVREVAEYLGHTPRSTEYQRVRGQLRQEEEEAGKVVIARPSTVTLLRLYETWDDVLVDAGFEPLGGRATAGRGCKRTLPAKWTEGDLWNALVQCAHAHGDEYFGGREYDRWRSSQPEPKLVPSRDHIRDRLAPKHGHWRKIMTVVLGLVVVDSAGREQPAEASE